MGIQPAVFIDRDGVINRTIFRDGKPRAPDRVEDFEFLDGVEEAVALLRAAGFRTVVVTNQPDVRRGWQTRERVDAMNRIVQERLLVDAIQACFHIADDRCECRKPRPGMILEAARALGIDLARSYMIGDRFSDVAAGREAGCVTLLVGAGDPTEPACEPDARVGSLLEGARWILTRPL